MEIRDGEPVRRDEVIEAIKSAIAQLMGHEELQPKLLGEIKKEILELYAAPSNTSLDRKAILLVIFAIDEFAIRDL